MPTIEVDFSDAPPAQGSNTSDHIPPGVYKLDVDKIDKQTAQTGREMVVVTLKVAQGEQTGRRLIERFVFPKSAEDSKFGLQRFHAFIVAIGFKEQTGKARITLEKLLGKGLYAEVDDEEVPASGNWPARIQSRPLAYYSKDKVPGAAPVAKPAAPAPVAEPEPAEAEEAAPEADLTEEPTVGSDAMNELLEEL